MMSLWIGFIALVLALLWLDLGVFHKDHHAISLKEAFRWTLFWVGVALVINVAIGIIYANHWFGAGLPSVDVPEGTYGMEAAFQFLTAYLLEKSLSFDNIFVIALIITFFRIQPSEQHRVLFWGILGAIVMRGLFVALGVILIRKFDWIFYVFGAILVITGLKMVFGKGEEKDPSATPYYRWLRRILPIHDGEHGGRFTTRVNGKFQFTTLFPALLIIELTDVMFAVDSVPAIFGITRDPFLVFTSNICAILGLRSLYFVLASSLNRFRYLKTAVTAILIFIGTKMLLHSQLESLPKAWNIAVSLGFIGIALTAGIIASLVKDIPASPPGESEEPLQS